MTMGLPTILLFCRNYRSATQMNPTVHLYHNKADNCPGYYFHHKSPPIE